MAFSAPSGLPNGNEYLKTEANALKTSFTQKKKTSRDAVAQLLQPRSQGLSSSLGNHLAGTGTLETKRGDQEQGPWILG